MFGDIFREMCDLIVDILYKVKAVPTDNCFDGSVIVTMKFERHGTS